MKPSSTRITLTPQDIARLPAGRERLALVAMMRREQELGAKRARVVKRATDSAQLAWVSRIHTLAGIVIEEAAMSRTRAAIYEARLNTYMQHTQEHT